MFKHVKTCQNLSSLVKTRQYKSRHDLSRQDKTRFVKERRLVKTRQENVKIRLV